MIVSLTPDERTVLEIAHNSSKDKKTAYRINIILLLDDGYRFEEIASILRLDDETVRRVHRNFLNSNSFNFIKSYHRGGVAKLTNIQTTELSNHLDNNLYKTTAEINSYVKEKYGIEYTIPGMSLLLKRLGFVYKKPVKIPYKTDISSQESFIEEYFAYKNSMGKLDKIYFLDAVHAIHNSISAYGWIRKGKYKQLYTNTGRQRLNINGAIDPDSLEVIARADDTIGTDSTIKLLKMIEKSNPKANTILLYLDNARYYYNRNVLNYIHNSSKLKAIFLPPYSPNLNPIERLWKFFKKKVLHNKFYRTFDLFKKACGEFFMTLPRYHDELSSLITEEFHLIEVQ